MKKNDKKQKKIKASKYESLGFCALTVILINVICIFLLTPIYQLLGALSQGMSVDVEREGTVLHVLCEVGANVLFYIASFLGTAAFFVGAFYVMRAVYDKKYKRTALASAILYFGMSISSIVTVATYGIIKVSDPTSISLSNPEALMVDVLFLLVRVLLCVACALVCQKLKAPFSACAVSACVAMFLCAVGLELYDNIPFFLKGIILEVDVINMVISMILYAIHACLGYITLMFFYKKREKVQQQNINE